MRQNGYNIVYLLNFHIQNRGTALRLAGATLVKNNKILKMATTFWCLSPLKFFFTAKYIDNCKLLTYLWSFNVDRHLRLTLSRLSKFS